MVLSRPSTPRAETLPDADCPDNMPSDVLSIVQQCVCRRGYLCAADISNCCTLADGVVGQMIYCTNNGRILLANSNQLYFNNLVKTLCHKTSYRCPHRLNLTSQ